MRYFDAATIRARLPWPRMLAALDAMLKRDVAAPLRTAHPIDVPGEPTASLLLMPAWRTGGRMGVKLVTVFPGNAQRNERAVGAVYALFDARNGAPLALFDGEEITARRTAGASAYAASRLARADARHLVLVGSGRLARGLVEAHALRPPDRAREPVEPHAGARAGGGRGDGGGRPAGHRDSRPRGRGAQRRHRLLRDAVHGAARARRVARAGRASRPVGAFNARMRETDDAAMARADLVVVDNRAAALAEGGDIVQAIASGAIDREPHRRRSRRPRARPHPGRTRADEITVFKSVGFALEDLAAAEAVFDAADGGRLSERAPSALHARDAGPGCRSSYSSISAKSSSMRLFAAASGSSAISASSSWSAARYVACVSMRFGSSRWGMARSSVSVVDRLRPRSSRRMRRA